MRSQRISKYSGDGKNGSVYPENKGVMGIANSVSTSRF